MKFLYNICKQVYRLGFNVKKKTCQVHFRCTDGEKEMIVQFSEKADLSISDYLRVAALQKKIRTNNKELLTTINTIIYSDNKLNTNINQIAHKLNSNNNISENDLLEIVNNLKLVAEKREKLFQQVTKLIHLLSS